MENSIIRFCICLLLALPIASPDASAAPLHLEPQLVIPDAQEIQILTTTDGSVRIGRIASLTDSAIRFETEFDESEIPFSSIDHIRTVSLSSIRKGEYWAPNPNATRLFFAPTGRMLKQGQGYFADYYIFLTTLVVGVTDNFTLGAGMSIMPGVSVGDQIFHLTPKVGGSVGENLHLATGAMMLRWSWDEDVENVGILYGVGTYGTPEASITAGMGYGYAEGGLANKPVFMIGGEKRLSRRTAFVTENWIVPGEQPLVSYGLRFIGDKLSVDLALLNTIGEEAIFPGIPYIDFVVSF